MEIAALIIEVFAISSLAAAFAEYTLEKRKAARFEEARNTLRRF